MPGGGIPTGIITEPQVIETSSKSEEEICYQVKPRLGPKGTSHCVIANKIPPKETTTNFRKIKSPNSYCPARRRLNRN
jgi:hypothetical protein